MPANHVARIDRELANFISSVVSLVAIKVTNNVAVSTPVDTGHAKANWVPSNGFPRTGVTGSRENVSYGPQKTGLAAVAKFHVRQGKVFIVNNVSYIGDLNNGSSAQAPSGFVQGGIFRGVAEATASAPSIRVSRA